MLNRLNRTTPLVVLILFITTACGSTVTTTSPSNTETNTSSSTETTPKLTPNLTLNYTLTIQIDSNDDNFDLTVAMEKTYEMDMHRAADGTLTLMANNMPRMVYRACAIGSNTVNCDGYSDAVGGFDIDIVLDSCGRLVTDEDCGENDDTAYTGEIDSNGNVNMEDISMRMRTFAISDNANGYTASDADTGLMELKRLVIDLTTDNVSQGDLSATGSPLDGNAVTLVAAGTISTTVPTLGGADFVATIAGEFE